MALLALVCDVMVAVFVVFKLLGKVLYGGA